MIKTNVEIAKMVEERGYDFAFDKNSHMVVSCGCVNCYDCLFYKSGCVEERINWSESEYIERPVISKRDKAFQER